MTPVPPVALPPQVRAVLYYLTFLAGLAVITIQSVYLATSQPQPMWLTVALIVNGALQSGFGITAASNTKVPASEPDVEP